MPSGHPDGYLEAFANLYSEIAEAILARQTGAAPQPWLFPTVEDGARGVQFMFAALASSQDGSRFVRLES